MAIWFLDSVAILLMTMPFSDNFGGAHFGAAQFWSAIPPLSRAAQPSLLLNPDGLSGND